MPSIASETLPSSPLQSATGPAALLEEFGPQEVARDARKLSAKVPAEQVPSVIAELPVAVAAYALEITCTVRASSAIAASHLRSEFESQIGKYILL